MTGQPLYHFVHFPREVDSGGVVQSFGRIRYQRHQPYQTQKVIRSTADSFPPAFIWKSSPTRTARLFQNAFDELRFFADELHISALMPPVLSGEK